jgi:GTP-binding protein YchF
MATIQLELILADMESVEKRLDRVARQAKTGDKLATQEHAALRKVLVALQEEKPARVVELTTEEEQIIKGYNLLTMKDVLYVANVSEDEVADADENPYVKRVREIAEVEGAGVVTISAQVEAEIAELDGEEREMFLEELGLQVSGLDRLINEAYRLLGLVTYFTAGEKEVRAWTIRQGTKAPGAGAVIHTDFERGFIRAEVVGYEELTNSGGFAGAREKGQLRLEGKEYVVQDGDIITFRFNV